MDAVLEAMKGQSHDGLSEVLPFVGLPTRKSPQELPDGVGELLGRIVSIFNEQLLSAIVKQTAQEFNATREQIFGDAQKIMRAMSDLARVIIPVRTLDRLTWESFEEMEADLTEQGIRRFGSVARDQAIFTVQAFRRISRLQNKILSFPPLRTDQERKRDQEIADSFYFYVTWAQFHMECLIAAMRFDKPIHPEVLESICEGLRAAVNAYGFIREGVELRMPGDSEQIHLPAWSKTDDELLQQSMSDMAAMDLEEW
jgi:hypothetical protein